MHERVIRMHVLITLRVLIPAIAAVTFSSGTMNASMVIGSAPAEAVGIGLDDGTAQGYEANHVYLIPPGTDHGTSGAPQTEAAHFTWVATSPPTGLTIVNYFIHSHSGADSLTAAEISRIQAAASVWNTSGANIELQGVVSDALADIHVEGSSTSGCGGTAIGCASFSWSLSHNPTGYLDGDPQHRLISNLRTPGSEILTMLTRSDWYTGANPGGIGASQLDYESVAIQEFGHLLGLTHIDQAGGHPAGDTAVSPMNSALPFDTTRRVLTASDITSIEHLYGTAVPEPATIVLTAAGVLFLAVRRNRLRVRGCVSTGSIKSA